MFGRKNSLLAIQQAVIEAEKSVPKSNANDEVEANKATASLLCWMLVAVVATFMTYNEHDGADVAASVSAGLVGFAFSQTPALLALHAPFQFVCVHLGLPFVGGGAIMVSQVGELAKESLAWFTVVSIFGICLLVLFALFRWKKESMAKKVQEKLDREAPGDASDNCLLRSLPCVCEHWQRLFYVQNGKYGVLLVNVLSLLAALCFIAAGTYGAREEQNGTEFAEQFGYLAVPQLGIGFAFSLMGILSIKSMEEQAESGAVYEFIFWVCGLFVEILPLTLELALDNLGDDMAGKRELLMTIAWIAISGNFAALLSFGLLFRSLFADEEVTTTGITVETSAASADAAKPADVNTPGTRAIVLPPAGQKSRGVAGPGTRDVEILKGGAPAPAQLKQEQPRSQGGSSASIVHPMNGMPGMNGVNGMPGMNGVRGMPGMVPISGSPGYGYNVPGYGMQQFGGPMGRGQGGF